eukprot:UN23238
MSKTKHLLTKYYLKSSHKLYSKRCAIFGIILIHFSSNFLKRNLCRS